MTDLTWPGRFEEIVRSQLPGIDSAMPVGKDLCLTDQGLDSLRTVSLLVALEDEFDVVFPDELLAASTFSTPGVLWQILEQLL